MLIYCIINFFLYSLINNLKKSFKKGKEKKKLRRKSNKYTCGSTVKGIIPDDSGGLFQTLKRFAEVENDLDVLSDPKQADDKY